MKPSNFLVLSLVSLELSGCAYAIGAEGDGLGGAAGLDAEDEVVPLGSHSGGSGDSRGGLIAAGSEGSGGSGSGGSSGGGGSASGGASSGGGSGGAPSGGGSGGAPSGGGSGGSSSGGGSGGAPSGGGSGGGTPVGTCPTPSVASMGSAKCGDTFIHGNSLYSCASQTVGVAGETTGCGTPGVYCSTTAPDHSGWGSTAWTKVQDCE